MLGLAAHVLQVLGALDIQGLVDLHMTAPAAPCIGGLAAPLQQLPVDQPTLDRAEPAMRDLADLVTRGRVGLGSPVRQFADEKSYETNAPYRISHHCQ